LYKQSKAATTTAAAANNAANSLGSLMQGGAGALNSVAGLFGLNSNAGSTNMSGASGGSLDDFDALSEAGGF
jgi:hypothetical protein